LLGYFEEAKGDALADRIGNGVPMNSVLFEVVVGARKATVIGAAVVAKLDLKAIQHASGG
jgi:hypothetical protein